jgi:GNAT superfamily N-acetyltransferase
MPTIRTLSPAEAAAAVPQLAEILIDCVHNGASVSFQPPVDRERAENFWRKVVDATRSGGTRLLVAERDGRIAGTVQLQFAASENQPHRAEIAKMLVHSSARRLGLGRALMQAAEAEAKRAAKTLLTLDTQTGSSAERLYSGLGWTRAGDIPNYALTPAGDLCSTTFFYKQI